jgi:hypothetical protein
MSKRNDLTDADWRAAQWTVAALGVVLMALALCQGGCGAVSSHRGILGNSDAIPDRCQCGCGPVAVSVGWQDGRGKLCAGAGAWRACWAVGGDQ